MCPRRATFLVVACFFGELRLFKSYSWCSSGTTVTGHDITDSSE
jgi:hypothetical protein